MYWGARTSFLAELYHISISRFCSIDAASSRRCRVSYASPSRVAAAPSYGLFRAWRERWVAVNSDCPPRFELMRRWGGVRDAVVGGLSTVARKAEALVGGGLGFAFAFDWGVFGGGGIIVRIADINEGACGARDGGGGAGCFPAEVGERGRWFRGGGFRLEIVWRGHDTWLH